MCVVSLVINQSLLEGTLKCKFLTKPDWMKNRMKVISIPAAGKTNFIIPTCTGDGDITVNGKTAEECIR